MSYRMVPAGDSALIVEFDERIDPVVNARAIALANAVHDSRVDGIRDVVPTYRSVAVYFDPLRTDHERLVGTIRDLASRPDSAVERGRVTVRIPVCYGGDLGPDLPAVAAFARLTEQEVIDIHQRGTYRVFMLGFVPGFAYMGIIDARIAMPRHSSPRLRVPVGTVAIAGVQTGIYPAETPGGWQLIGRTPLRPFDPNRAEPFLLKAGDAVRFFAIDRADFDRSAEA